MCYGWGGGWRHVTTNFRGVDVVPLLGAIVGCHCSVLWLGGRVTTNWSGRGAIAGCHCSVLWWGEGSSVLRLGRRVTNNFGGVDVVPLLGAIAGCHCRVLWWGKGRVTTNFGGVDVPLQGAHGTIHSNGIQKKHPEKLPWASCRRGTVLYIDEKNWFLLSGVYAGIIFFVVFSDITLIF